MVISTSSRGNVESEVYVLQIITLLAKHHDPL